MKYAVVGSRDYEPLEDVDRFIAQLPPDAVVVTGGARGVDQRAEEQARARGLAVIVIRAEWQKPCEHGDGCLKDNGRGPFYVCQGIARNRLIVDASDVVCAFWNGWSNGTRFTIQYAEQRGKPVEHWCS